MKKLLFSVMACYALTARAQVQETKNYLYLYSDSIVYANKIQLRPDFSGYWQLRVDSRRIPVDQVKFFNNENGFFANTRKLSYSRFSEFSERIVEGKINLFQERSYDPYAYHRSYRYGNNRHHPANLSLYYNKGFGDLKLLRYKNLKTDLADHPESMQFLNSYKKNTKLSRTMYVTAGASMIAGMVALMATGTGKEDFPTGNGFGGPHSIPSIKSPNYTAAFLLMGLGFGFAVGGFAVQVSASRNMERAIDSYNR